MYSLCLLLMLAQQAFTTQTTSIAAECAEISFMAPKVFLTYAKDTILDGNSGPLLDVHTFNQYFTFQIDPPEKEGPQPSSIEQSFIVPQSSGEGFIIKLRSELSSAFSDQAQQGMRVTIIDKSQNGGILVDANSLDNDQGFIILEYDKLQDGKEYTIRYDLYDKEVVSNDDLAELTSTSTGIMCKLPFITQELLIMDKRLVKHRISQYNKNMAYDVKNVKDGFKCNFGSFNNTLDSEYGEDGISCEKEEYTYSINGNTYSSYSSKPFSILYEHPFQVRGAKNELITYWYEMLIGLNFMVSSSLKVILSRNDIEFNDEDPYKCLYDKSCVLASMGQKNQLKLDLILTSGLYKLIFIEEESESMKQFLTSEAGLTKRPITFALTSYPVVQNEERVNCPYMYVDKDFFQNRFIEGKGGRRFTMSDKVIMNVFNLTQEFNIRPEVDSLLKIRIKETFGVNTAILINSGEDSIAASTQIGTTELLFAKLQKNVDYQIELSFAQSLIQTSEFFSCPHFNIEFTMISISEASEMVKKNSVTSKSNFDNESKLDDIFNNVTSSIPDFGYVFLNHDQVFQFYVDQTEDVVKTLNYVVASKTFITDDRMQFFTEIFYEPYLYDLEISIFSTDINNLRSHQNDKSYKKIDWTLYKGSKSLFMELEPGQYEFKIIQKLPPLSNDDLSRYQQNSVQFQLQVILNQKIDRQQILPSTLNYFGLLGPEGKNFGEMVYHCQDCVMENIMYKTIDFTVNDDSLDINFNAMISSATKQIQLKLETVEWDNNNEKADFYEEAFIFETDKGKSVGKKNIVGKGKTNEIEESISAEKLSSKVRYRIVIVNNGGTDVKQTFNIRLEFLEKPKSSKSQNYHQLLPQSIDEIKREKIRTEGLKESDFLVGTKFMMQWIDSYGLYPYVKKSQKVYQTMYYDDDKTPFMVALKFEVKEEEALIFASVYDYSGVASLGLMITDADDLEDDWEVVSVPGKYQSYIPPIALTKGNYYLVISPMSSFDYEQGDVIKFGLDFLYEREDSNTDYTTQVLMNSMELCNLARIPRTLNSPEFISDLSGQALQILFRTKLQDFIQEEMLFFDLKENSLVNIYIELPKSVSGQIEVAKKQGTYKLKASTEDLNENLDTFIKSKQFKHQNIIQMREFLNPGKYELRLSGTETTASAEFGMPVCTYAKIGISVAPITHAKASLHDQCNQTTTMGNKLEFGKHVTGNLTFNAATQVMDTAYINLEKQGEGPFFLYFQLNYDFMQEGILALTLHKYDKDALTFEEVQLYLAQDQQTFSLAIVDEGIFVLSVISMSSTYNKYIKALGQGRSEFNQNLLQDSCLRTSFSYYLTSAISHDTQQVEVGFNEFLDGLFGMGGLFDDLDRQRKTDDVMREALSDILSPTCQYEEIPTQFLATESGYDLTYNFMFSHKPFELIDLIVEEESLFKIQINVKNPKNSVNVFIYENADMKNLLAFTMTSSIEKKFTLILRPQKKAYKIKIVQDALEEADSCPTFQIRVALKPLILLPDENLKCSNKELPPSSIRILTDNFDLDGEYQFSYEFYEKYLKQNDMKKDVTYDIEIKFPDKNKQYFFDIENKQDFLTTDISFELFGKDENNKNQLVSLGTSTWYNENEGEASLVANDKTIVNRMKLNNVVDQLSSGQKLGDTAILRLRFSRRLQSMINVLKNKNLINDKQPACFTFDLSIRVSQVAFVETTYTSDTDPIENELVRIDWSAKMKDQLFDPRQKLSVFLQFKESMKEEYKTLKFSQFAYLSPENLTTKEDSNTRIYPQTVRLSTVDKSSLILTFQHNSLDKGRCYKLMLDEIELGVRIDEDSLKEQGRICTSKCQCNSKGMKECDEKVGQCICHHPFSGPDCYQCVQGFVYNPNTFDCEPTSRCIGNGGKEDCNGHGDCFEDENTGQAKCHCHPGFINDGLDYCGKCFDPLFTYPNCDTRNWIVEPSVYNCGKLQTKLPVQLWNKTTTSERPYQNEEGLLVWAGVYKLQPSAKREKLRSNHYFAVPQNSIMRLFIDAHDSGVKAKFKILDDSKRVLISSKSEADKTSNGLKAIDDKEISFLLIKQTGKDPKANPYKLEIEYEFDNREYDMNSCPMMEIYMLVQPLTKIQDYLKCSQDEISQSKESKNFKYQFGYDSQFINEKFTLTSDMKAGNSYINEDNQQYMTLKYDFIVNQDGNALSVIGTYSFEEIFLAFTLTDKKTGNIIGIEKYSSLEDIDNNLEEITITNDMITYLEMPSLDYGEYQLEILVLKGLFLPKKNIITCLSFDLAIEYVARRSTNNNDYEVVSVMPNQAFNLTKEKKQKIQLKFNKKIGAIEELSSSGTNPDMSKLFYLESMSDSSIKIYPVSAMISEKETLSLFFNFKYAELKENQQCFKLKSGEFLRPFNLDTKYCFEGLKQLDSKVKCNPNAMAKVVNNKCICNHPYKGSNCEQCDDSFNPTFDLSKHTVCVMDLAKCSQDICNSHGVCQQLSHFKNINDFKCQCYPQYEGMYCEKCKDPKLAYPDCDQILDDVYSETQENPFLKRRQYTQDGYQKTTNDQEFQKLAEGTMKEQCQISTYPKDLNKIEFMGLFGGEMHIADYYTINHDQDNLIKFIPKSQGHFKMFIQEPELEEMKINGESFDLEIGLYDPENDKFLATSVNQLIDFRDKKNLNGKLNYAVVQTQIPFDYVGKTLYVIFRAVNFTISAYDALAECEAVYIELEYREKARECQNNPDVKFDSQIIKVDQGAPYKTNDQQNTYSVQGKQNSFFHYQDFYLGDSYSEEQESDYEIKIGIYQKFIERNLVDFLIEILEESTPYNEIDFRKYQYQSDQPQCDKLCLISGQKAYNEFHNVVQVSAKSLIRVWLHQQAKDGACGNYQLFLEANKINLNNNQFENLNDVKCEELDLPSSFNADRYLGSYNNIDSFGSIVQQKNFHYLERFRVDNLRNNSAHTVDFTLKEPTLVRFVASVHQHIEFDLVLKEKKSRYATKKLIESSAKGYEDSIFAQLDSGDYQLQLLFMSEEFYMQQPCQSIQMEIAMSKIKDIKTQLNDIKGLANTNMELNDIIQNENRQLNVFRSKAIKSFQLGNIQKTGDQAYSSYIELYSKRFVIPKVKNLGILIQIRSDFLLNNVNFALTNVNNNKVLPFIRRENFIQLVSEQIPGGDYEFLVYAHNFLGNINNEDQRLDRIDVTFQIDFNFIRWLEQDDFKNHTMNIDIADRTFKVQTDVLSSLEYKCYEDYVFLNQEMTPNLINGAIDFNQEVMIPVIENYHHQMTYKPNQDGLRITIDRSNTKSKIQPLKMNT